MNLLCPVASEETARCLCRPCVLEVETAMDSVDVDNEQIDDRRAFLHDLQTHEDIVNTDFSRDGFQEIYIKLEADTGFHKTLQERARKLGYRIEHRCGCIYCLSQA